LNRSAPATTVAILLGAVALPKSSIATSSSTLKSPAAVAVAAARPCLMVAESVPEPALESCLLRVSRQDVLRCVGRPPPPPPPEWELLLPASELVELHVLFLLLAVLTSVFPAAILSIRFKAIMLMLIG
jgi:hypothetical protein